MWASMGEKKLPGQGGEGGRRPDGGGAGPIAGLQGGGEIRVDVGLDPAS